ncbi:dienelactone hydrolase family protein [Methylopila musalis]|uniref:dienelactone hydrolase family protein n=1 Tax=Methylopila musalis TaxID=1134781 RepID=UPI00366DA42F
MLAGALGLCAAGAGIAPATAAVVAPDDRRLNIERVTAEQAGIAGLLARGRTETKRPAVLILPDADGLTPHREDVTRRLAVAGFLALGVEAPPENADETLARTVAYLAHHLESKGDVGVLGFGRGGDGALRLAAMAKPLKAVVAYDGRGTADEASAAKAALQLHYAGLAGEVTATIPAFKAALESGEKTFELFLYEGVAHGFEDADKPETYARRPAELAWDRAIAFLESRLGAAPPVR